MKHAQAVDDVASLPIGELVAFIAAHSHGRALLGYRGAGAGVQYGRDWGAPIH